jgi:hypothetical protein
MELVPPGEDVFCKDLGDFPGKNWIRIGDFLCSAPKEQH